MLQLAANPTSGSPVAAPVATMPESRPSAQVAEAPDPNGQQRKNSMIGRANGSADVNPHRLTAPVSPWNLQAGSVIAASLRSEERRVGKESVEQCSRGWSREN